MSASSNDWFTEQFNQKFEEASRELGKFNLAVFGKTGVGKSTLINAIFGEEVAATGIGQPVTMNSHLYLHNSGSFGMLDTRGLEIGEDTGTIIAELREFMASVRRLPMSEQIHVAWYCVRFGDRRFEETEGEFIRELDKLGLPVILVMTQVPMRNGQYHPDAQALSEDIQSRRLPIYGGFPYPTYAKADEFAGYEPHGLLELLDATFRCAPEGVLAALTAAQKIDYDRKREVAQKAINAAVTAAGAAGATPIPFSDAAVLVPIQLTMMAKIANIYGIKLERATAAGLAATAGATTLGRSIAGNMIKMIPGVGSVVGGAITGTVAAGVTWAMGQAWLEVCDRMARGQLETMGGALDSDSVRDLFSAEFKKQARKRLPGGGSDQRSA